MKIGDTAYQLILDATFKPQLLKVKIEEIRGDQYRVLNDVYLEWVDEVSLFETQQAAVDCQRSYLELEIEWCKQQLEYLKELCL